MHSSTQSWPILRTGRNPTVRERPGPEQRRRGESSLCEPWKLETLHLFLHSASQHSLGSKSARRDPAGHTEPLPPGPQPHILLPGGLWPTGPHPGPGSSAIPLVIRSILRDRLLESSSRYQTSWRRRGRSEHRLVDTV
ncbi:uncharacterized protein LOC116576400 isoform X4 [Mustela erminea]|uniref:uncharacterized protein LOC116576400 isoform X4 n=1 Tax=Mustela erminea TaxID=36723 RepID=UPI0013870B0A|nr:uncharacterized protein LOC116576400 isoform X4 [Mustela erminea]